MESNSLPGGAQLPQRSTRLEHHIQTFVPFHRLSVSNLPPTELELSEIETAILPSLAQDIVVVDSAVTAARLALESLEQERDALANIKQNLKNITSPQRRIPPEILSKIFLYGDSLDDRDLDEMFDWTSRIIWRLRQVCQTWRNVALSLPSCWSFIVLDFSSRWPAFNEDAELLLLVLERSQKALLDIILIQQNVKDRPLLSWMRARIFAESYRWRSARLIDNQLDWSDLQYAPLRGRLPRLELLHIQRARTWRSYEVVISAFKDCPRLVEITLNGVDPREVELPVQQITRLRLLDRFLYSLVGDFEVYLHFIGQFPLLEFLCVDFTNDHHGPFLPYLTLPRMRELSAMYPYLIDSLVLPGLEVAALGGKLSTINPDTLHSFYSLIRRSHCASNLVDLRINRVSLALHPSEPHLLLSVLSQTTALATLQVEASMIDRRQRLDVWSVTQIMDVMRALEVVPGQTITFLPRLVSLELNLSEHTDMEYVPYLKPFDEFVSMLKARRAGNEYGLSKLKQFRFCLQTSILPGIDEHDSDQPVFDDHEIAVLQSLAGDEMSLRICFEGALSFKL